MVVCSLDMVGSRLKELHSLLLIATELRHLHSACKAAMTRMLRSKQSARNTLLKVFALFGSEDPSMAPGGQNQWESTKDMFRHELQVQHFFPIHSLQSLGLVTTSMLRMSLQSWPRLRHDEFIVISGHMVFQQLVWGAAPGAVLQGPNH